MAGVLSDQFKRMNLQTKTVGEDRIKRAKERNEDVAILSMELPGEKKGFKCSLGELCLQGDPTSLPLGRLGCVYVQLKAVTQSHGGLNGRHVNMCWMVTTIRCR